MTGAQADTQTVDIDVTVQDPGCEITVDNASPTLKAINSSHLLGGGVQALGSFNLKLENCFGKLATAKNLNVAVSGITVQDDKVFRGTASTSAGAGFVLFWNVVTAGTYAKALKTTDTALNWPGTGGVDLSTLDGSVLPIAVGGVAYGSSGVTAGSLTGSATFAISVK